MDKYSLELTKDETADVFASLLMSAGMVGAKNPDAQQKAQSLMEIADRIYTLVHGHGIFVPPTTTKQ